MKYNPLILFFVIALSVINCISSSLRITNRVKPSLAAVLGKPLSRRCIIWCAHPSMPNLETVKINLSESGIQASRSLNLIDVAVQTDPFDLPIGALPRWVNMMSEMSKLNPKFAAQQMWTFASGNNMSCNDAILKNENAKWLGFINCIESLYQFILKFNMESNMQSYDLEAFLKSKITEAKNIFMLFKEGRVNSELLSSQIQSLNSGSLIKEIIAEKSLESTVLVNSIDSDLSASAEPFDIELRLVCSDDDNLEIIISKLMQKTVESQGLAKFCAALLFFNISHVYKTMLKKITQS